MDSVPPAGELLLATFGRVLPAVIRQQDRKSVFTPVSQAALMDARGTKCVLRHSSIFQTELGKNEEERQNSLAPFGDLDDCDNCHLCCPISVRSSAGNR